MNAARYCRLGPVTDPGRHRQALLCLSPSVAAVAEAVGGLLLHVNWAERYGVIDGDRVDESSLRWVEAMLDRLLELDGRPLEQPRVPGRRLFATCRDFAVLTCSALKALGRSARVRCGFARYLVPGRHEDHWLCEYSGDGRWVRVDAQLDELQRSVLGIQFCPLDVPSDQFITAGEVWLGCRTAGLGPMNFGIGDLRGMWFVRGSLIRDAASLIGIEALPWDEWGLVRGPDSCLGPDDWRLLDRLAELTLDDKRLEELSGLMGDDRLRPPPGLTGPR